MYQTVLTFSGTRRGTCRIWPVKFFKITLATTFSICLTMYWLKRDRGLIFAKVCLENPRLSLPKKTDLEQLVRENGVINLSHGLPGLIIQSYLIIVKLFELDVMEPVDFVTKIENSTNDQVVEINTQEAESGRGSSPFLYTDKSKLGWCSPFRSSFYRSLDE